MKLSIPTKNTGLFPEYLRVVRLWFVKTPERALEEAYQTALLIKAMEDEHFGGQKISPNSGLHSESVMACLLADVDKHLNTVKLRVAEFKLSRSVLRNSAPKLLVKLGLIDEIVAKYTTTSELELASNSDLLEINPQQIDTKRKPNEIVKAENTDVFQKKGVLPRSIGRTVNRIKTDLNPNSEQEVITQFRRSSHKTKMAIRFVILLILVPLLTQQLSKFFLINPIVQRFRNETNFSVFLNKEMKEEALTELKTFEEELRFASFINHSPQLSSEVIEQRVQRKADEIAEEFRSKGNDAIANVFADLLALVAFAWLVINSRKEIIALKSFMDEVVYGLSDSAKAFIIILLTDMFVGYHSTHGWEILLEGMANHLGIAANKSVIFLFIATFPVMLDTIFKYWIFRYLSRVSPSAVATLKNMNE
ncbi:proton extrusion protein PcxA [Scytonema sp. UIC 10036]|uniref:proton extrusion protein PcxA n=1 Tax=Scytonema sp. UIC 10036 TaxID=2304196 RepID=UPI0012DA7D66|nr:proton extrusion protein PcxA [Scytonema sp. UIC 10036]MUG91936.1 proton extrusion protein PcxA [Scytonema sp. UIC 10036]